MSPSAKQKEMYVSICKAHRSAGGIRRPQRLPRKENSVKRKKKVLLDCKCKLAT